MSTAHDIDREAVLAEAHRKALAALSRKPTAENIKNESAAARALADYRASKDAEANPSERRFANLREVHAHLAGEGWKVSQSALYEHRDRGKVPNEKDGTYSRAAVDEYARLHLERVDGSSPSEPGMAEKIQIETRIAQERLNKLKRENEIEAGLWVLRSEVEQKHTTKLALLLTAVDNYIHGGKLEEGIDLVNGDKARAAEFKEHIKKGFRAALAEYAKRPEFAVPKQAVTEAEAMIEEVEG